MLAILLLPRMEQYAEPRTVTELVDSWQDS